MQRIARTVITPAAKISSDTWRRLSRAHSLRVRLGEETLTDLLILDMSLFQTSNQFRIAQITKRQESKWGADLLVWIWRKDGLSRFLAIQAKKLSHKGRYERLNHRLDDGTRQIDLLEDFARQYNAVPLYLLYNHINFNHWNRYWHCCKSADIEQLGCTLVPSWKIDHAINSWGQKNFKAIHKNYASRPWRCAFDCNCAELQLKALVANIEPIHPFKADASISVPEEAIRSYPELLPIKFNEFPSNATCQLTSEFLDQLLVEIGEHQKKPRQYESSVEEFPLYPRRLLFFDETKFNLSE